MDVIVIGAGAAGLMCAMEAGRRGRRALVLEHTDRICSKVRISGGGRCNFTNRNVSSRNYLSRNLRFSTSALSRFTPTDFVSMLEKHRIGFHEKEEGQLFCNESSQAIIDMLQAECEKASVNTLLNCRISGVGKDSGFSVSTNQGTFNCESLVVATGGLSLPNIGATELGYSIARRFGLKVTALKPALTPLRFSREDAELFGPLAGISIHSAVRHSAVEFRGNILFTHNGLSGPAILQASSYWNRNSSIIIDLFPDIDIFDIFMKKRHSRMLLPTLLDRYLPGRFAKIWCNRYCQSKPLNQYSSKELDSIAKSLHGWEMWPAGVEGFNKAEVTSGGVDTSELSSKTMESKKVPGLYFVGEVIDVTGHLGGYNLHWAWASGHAAGLFA
ncbi:MAG: NAD(P)/FAD-dependent oxidoreductase [Desulforhabdus sp.]|nr:NAD(P)/FAD-dependent oxidoreductase [Desulforhabdus sp.]